MAQPPRASPDLDPLRLRALDYLSPGVRQAVLLHWQGLTNAQVARALGITRALVGMRLLRARRRLARWPELQALVVTRPGSFRGRDTPR